MGAIEDLGFSKRNGAEQATEVIAHSRKRKARLKKRGNRMMSNWANCQINKIGHGLADRANHVTPWEQSIFSCLDDDHY